MSEPTQPVVPLTIEEARRRSSRNWAIALSLIGLVLLFYFVTLVKGPGVLGTGM